MIDTATEKFVWNRFSRYRFVRLLNGGGLFDFSDSEPWKLCGNQKSQNTHVALFLLFLAASFHIALGQNTSPFTSTYDRVFTFAGTGTPGTTGNGGLATSAQMTRPFAVVFDNQGNVYVDEIDSGQIRRVFANNGTIETFFGPGTCSWGSCLATPIGMDFDPISESFLVGDVGNNRVLRVFMNKTAVLVAGGGASTANGAQATQSSINVPANAAFESSGNILVLEHVGAKLRRIGPDGTINTIAGSPTGATGFSGDGGPAASALFNHPDALLLSCDGSITISDRDNHRIRKIFKNGTITTIAGNGTGNFYGENVQATSASLYYPKGLFLDSFGNLFFSDSGNCRIRMINPDGIIKTVVGNGTCTYNGENVPVLKAGLYTPNQLKVRKDGVLLVSSEHTYRVLQVRLSGLPIPDWHAKLPVHPVQPTALPPFFNPHDPMLSSINLWGNFTLWPSFECYLTSDKNSLNIFVLKSRPVRSRKGSNGADWFKCGKWEPVSGTYKAGVKVQLSLRSMKAQCDIEPLDGAKYQMETLPVFKTQP